MRSHHTRAASGGSGATDLASFFGVDSTASTTVRFENLDSRYDCEPSQPTGWQSYHTQTVDSNGEASSGRALSMVGITSTDNLGMFIQGNTNGYSYGTNGYPTNTVICNSASVNTTTNVWFGNPSNITNNSGSSSIDTGRSIAHTHPYSADSNQAWCDIVFSTGLGDALGFVLQASLSGTFGGYSLGNLFTGHNPICRMTCNGISATFAPKGYYASDSNTQVGTYYTTFAGLTLYSNTTTNGGHVAYPTIYDDTTTTDIDSHFKTPFTGTTTTSLPSTYFVY